MSVVEKATTLKMGRHSRNKALRYFFLSFQVTMAYSDRLCPVDIPFGHYFNCRSCPPAFYAKFRELYQISDQQLTINFVGNLETLYKNCHRHFLVQCNMCCITAHVGEFFDIFNLDQDRCIEKIGALCNTIIPQWTDCSICKTEHTRSFSFNLP